MAAAHRRDKLVYFRISGQEFEEIRKACETKGARSVSDLARSAVQAFISSPGNQFEQQTGGFLRRLQMLVDELERSIQHLMSRAAAADAGGVLDQHVEEAPTNRRASNQDGQQALGDIHE
jgi:hypothetical protein